MWVQAPGAFSFKSKTRSSERLTKFKISTGVELAVTVLDGTKAKDIVVLDLRSISAATDYFIIASGTSDLHVRSLGERVLERLVTRGINPHHSEGLQAGRWVLLDFVDFVVHIFHPELREFYQLERLWADAPLVLEGSGG